MTPLRKTLTAAAAGLALTGGSIAVAAVGPLGIAGAQDDPAPTVQDDAALQDDAEQNDTGSDVERPEKGERLLEALQPLVDDGTLTEAQADAVVERLREAHAEHAEERGHHGRRGNRGASLELIEEITGLTPEELREGFANGETLAELAGDSADELEAAMVAQAEARVDAAVEAGRIDASQADEIKAGMAERIEARLNTVPDRDGEGRPGRGGPRGPRGGFGADSSLDGGA
ncbi:MAG: hypothetical protein HKN26_06745 [Acidimicrobiales bacterium]|nr:hypothetical protein [Acidimicrobiales bacterium]